MDVTGVTFTADTPLDAAKFIVSIQSANKGTLTMARLGIPAIAAAGKETHTASFKNRSDKDFKDFVSDLARRSPGHIFILEFLSRVPFSDNESFAENDR
jgi:hypothetical protein